MNALEQIVFANHRVVKLDFGVAAFKFLTNFGIGDSCAGSNQIAQLVEQYFRFNALFELRDTEIRLPKSSFVFVLSYEFAFWEEDVGVAAVLQFVAQLLIVDAQTEALGFRQNYLLIDEVVGCPRCEKGQQHGGLSSRPRHLLTQHLPGLTLHFERSDILACHAGHDTAWRRTEAEGGTDTTGHERDHHGGANDQQ